MTLNPRGNVPKKHFLRWLQEDSNLSQQKLKYDFAKEALPYSTMIVVFLLIVLFPRPELMTIGLALITLAFKISKRI